MREEREGNEGGGDPKETEATIYEQASWDWLAGVGGTCVGSHSSLTLMKDRQHPGSLTYEGVTRLLS